MPPALTLLDAWTYTVRASPDACVLIDAGSARKWSRADIDAEADNWCRQHRQAAGGQVVAVAEPNGAEWLRIFLALLKCDAVIAPLDPGEPIATQRTIACSVGATQLWRSGH